MNLDKEKFENQESDEKTLLNGETEKNYVEKMDKLNSELQKIVKVLV